MIAMISLLIVATHVVLFIGLILLDLVQKEKNA
jgi:preprotein translocase subunit SecG